jgi:hypothetical protein
VATSSYRRNFCGDKINLYCKSENASPLHSYSVATLLFLMKLFLIWLLKLRHRLKNYLNINQSAHVLMEPCQEVSAGIWNATLWSNKA